MYPIDSFLNQLILCGLADYQVITLIEHHYLKLLTLYNIISNIDENNIDDMDCDLDTLNDTLSITIYLKEELTQELDASSEDFEVQIINNKNVVNINIINDKFESEEDIYEDRFARCKKIDNSQWS